MYAIRSYYDPGAGSRAKVWPGFGTLIGRLAANGVPVAVITGPAEAGRGDGVRNFQARNFMRDGMKRGDLAFFYHSNCPEPGIVGVVEGAREAYPDPT